MSFLRCLMPSVPRSVLRYTSICNHRQILTKTLRNSRQIRFNSTAATTPGKPDTSLSGKLKQLSKKYGRAAIVVYLGISAIDFGIAFAAVHSLGAKRIGAYEDKFFRVVEDWTGYKKTTVNQVEQASENGAVQDDTTSPQTAAAAGVGKGSIWTEAAIAYGIHKALFIFIRIPITVAITPSIVKALVRRGWKIGPARVNATKNLT